MGARVFLDTNIVLRLFHQATPHHQIIEQRVRQLHSDQLELWISRQVIREYMVQVSRPGFLARSLSPEKTVTNVEALRTSFRVTDETDAVTTTLIDLIQRKPTGGKQIHDANIVASMLVYDIGELLTLNVEDFRRFSDIIQVTSPLETQQ